MKKIVLLFILLAQLSSLAWAQHSFVIRRIEIEGLQRISDATAESYLPVKRGQLLRPAKTGDIVRALYRTGFFSHISIARDGDVLIIHVTERPTIGQLKISGNSVIPTDKLQSVMKTLDIAEGRVYNPVMLERIKQGLLNQYFQLGYYNASVEICVTPLPRNRVFVKIEISEGLVAKIKHISIIGNHTFKEKRLINQLDITTVNAISFFTQSDRYSEGKLESSLEKLRGFYLDRGFIHFEVKSSQAEITPDHKSVYITIVIEEGPVYTLESYDFSGPLIGPREDYDCRMLIRAGDVFSRSKLIESEKAISTYLGEKGYMFSNVAVRPKVNDETHTVSVVIDVRPGKRTYVRQVTISDNVRTNENVLRREIQQLEGAPASTTKLEDSKQRLRLLPYIKDVDMGVKPTDVDDQVDLDFKVKEESAAQISFKIGYQQDFGFTIGGGMNHTNFLGTGNTLGINLQRTQYEQFYGIDYTDPYYTEDGISRSINLSVSRTNPNALRDFASGYAINTYGLGLNYTIPVGQECGVFSRIVAGLNYQNFLIVLDSKNQYRVSNQVRAFIQRHGRRFQQLDLRLGFTRNSQNKAIFPTCGGLQTFFADLFLPASSGSLSFYTLNYHSKYYFPLMGPFIFTTSGDFGYGNSFQGPRGYPFFKNYYAGGIQSVRGYQTYTLGPLDSNGEAYGGNILVNASVGLIFPNFISDSVRTSVFVDAGNVYSILNNRQFGCSPVNIPPTCSTNAGPIRYSVGIEADWLSPFGPIRLSLAKPLNMRQPPDKSEPFQFEISSNF